MTTNIKIQQRRKAEEPVKVSRMKTEWKFNVPAAEPGANPLPRGLTISIFIETEAAFSL